jgi:probable rRNA maturation factor
MIILDPDLDPDPALPSTSAKKTAASGSPISPRNLRVPTARTLSSFLALARKTVRLKGRVTVLLTTDSAIRKLNRQFRGKNKATDVLSFPADGSFPAEGLGAQGYAGDLAISIPTARKQAVEQGHSLSTEVKVLILHGLLHLSGYDHEADEGQMARQERLLRARLGLPQGLIERAGLPKIVALKGHGFSRAAKGPKMSPALAAEGRLSADDVIPQGLKPNISINSVSARLKSCPFKAAAKRKRP